MATYTRGGYAVAATSLRTVLTWARGAQSVTLSARACDVPYAHVVATERGLPPNTSTSYLRSFGASVRGTPTAAVGPTTIADGALPTVVLTTCGMFLNGLWRGHSLRALHPCHACYYTTPITAVNSTPGPHECREPTHPPRRAPRGTRSTLWVSKAIAVRLGTSERTMATQPNGQRRCTNNFGRDGAPPSR